MNVAIFSESEADEAAIRILTDGILGEQTQAINLPNLRSRGWPSVLKVLPSVLKHLHYQTDADALIVIVDSDKSPVHQAEHAQSEAANEGCRLCLLRETVSRTQTRLRPVPDRTPIRIAIGLAVPQIEAWYRCGVDPQVTEAAWILALQSGIYPYDGLKLKQLVYGTSRPAITLMKTRAVEEATRLARSLDLLENFFANGFGCFANDLRNWMSE
jgi:hypothetical protein